MDTNSVYSEVLLDHASHPDYNFTLENASVSHEGVNPSCGDDLVVHIRLGDNDTIAEASWTGSGCAISQASADMMSDLIIGKTAKEARELCQLFMRMVRGEETNKDLLEQELDEACCLESMSRMPARVKCAELAWHTLNEMLSGKG